MNARLPVAKREESLPVVHYGYSLTGVLFVASDDGEVVSFSPEGALRMAMDFLGLSAADLAAVAEQRGRPLRGLIDSARECAAGEADPDTAESANELLERGFRLTAPDMDDVGRLAQGLFDRGFRWHPAGDGSLGWWVIPTALGHYRVTDFAADFCGATRRLSRAVSIPA